jgi:predicted nucleic acid-binding protein
VIYLDTSAVVKLVWREQETDALHGFLAKWPETPLVSSALLLVETRRAVLRVDPSGLQRADLLLTRVGKVGLTGAVLEAASRIPDPHLRSLDAIHLATALLLRDDLDALITYDQRLAAAAGGEGLPVQTPGA